MEGGKDLGWDDVRSNRHQGGELSGQMGQMGQADGEGLGGNFSDAMTSAMVKHFASELTRDSLSMWPQFVHATRRYFNVTHSYVVRKILWELVPTSHPKAKSADGELGGEKDCAARIYEGLEVDIEEPDLYIPAMGFVTYLLLVSLISGLQEKFRPDTFSSTITFCMVLLVLETTATKVALVMSGAENAPICDLLAMLGYKFMHLSLQLIVGLLLGWGHQPAGVLYYLVALGLVASYGVALWQTLRRLARMQPLPAAPPELHQIVLKCIPVLQLFTWWCLLPSWPKALPRAVAAAAAAAASPVVAAAAQASPAAAAVAAVAATVAPAVGNATGLAAAAAAAAKA